jgi:hypothetical protein
LPTDWADIRQRWLTLHTFRTLIAILAFITFLAAQTLDHGATGPTADSPVTKRPAVPAAP